MKYQRLFASASRWLLVGVFVASAHADPTDLASVPLITSAPQAVLPNLMFILDDSGSMAWTHMPDDTDNFGTNGSGTARYGYASAQCNGVYYNPNIVYRPPVQVSSSGIASMYPNSSFTNAWINGYNTSAGTVNLNTSFRAWTTSTVNNTNLDGTQDSAQQAYYYTYSGSQTTDALKNYFDTNSTFYRECYSLVNSTPGSAVFARVNVSDTSAERTNFANWYSYYRTRMLSMKTASGHAFNTVGDQYRVGYMSINNNVSGAFLNLATFTGAQKGSWYSYLYGATPNNSTPLRQALSDAGRIYAAKISTINGVSVGDPIQYSCQKNFALLSTDGYWNGNDGYQVDGSTSVGSPDSSEPRPFYDGGSSSTTYQSIVSVTTSSSSTTVSNITVNGFRILSGTATTSGNNGNQRRNNLASSITQGINNCTTSTTGNCTVSGFSAVRSGSDVTITAPASWGPTAFTPVVTIAASGAVTVTAFSALTVTTGGASDTLADVADYYYKTDLRSGALNNQNITGSSPAVDISANNVLASGDDDATWQHMTTFTLGLGARGRMIYSPSYKTDTTGDYASVKNLTTASSSVCTWQSSGTTCNWPTPGSNNPENIDDLWHAAVNGRGSYFSATDPASLAVGLLGALQGIDAMTSDAAAATTSNPNVTAGDNYIFSSTFRSAEWYGELERRQIDPTNGTLAASPDWTARAQLDSRSSRTIYTLDPTNATSKLKSFVWANLTATEQGYFGSTYLSSTASPTLSQFCASGDICLSSASQTAASGSTLVDFIRGDRTNEGAANNTSRYYRQRTSRLGDIVNSEAVYVNRPQFDYVDSGYTTFKTTGIATTRTPMVYVGANDGMLHAFNAATGDEAWAYIPAMLIPNLYRLADKYYPTHHQFYVDGSPVVADVYFGSAWHTILVGGLNSGGRGYYALDITDPANPKALWEFTDTNMGYSYGRPEITKLKNGTWVVLLTSGYNNVSPGDGGGHLFVVDAGSGAVVQSSPGNRLVIDTGVGSSSAAVAGACATAPCPSGLTQIRAWVDNTRYDNTAQRVYGGDLFGNVWRFDINGDIGAAGYDAQLLATLNDKVSTDSTRKRQPITSRPELGKVAGYATIYIGTGQYLGASDLSNGDQQTIYAIKDTLGSTSLGNPRDASASFVQQTLTNDTCPPGSAICTEGDPIRTSSNNVVNFATNNGWYVNLPGTRERANTDPQLALGTLAFTSNLLNPSACTVGGSSFINYLDYRTGGAVGAASGNNIASLSLGGALATRTVQLRFDDGSRSGTVRSLIRMSDGTWQTPDTPIDPSPGGIRRTSWRELITE